MILLKIYYHIQAFIAVLFYKIIYFRKLKFGKGTTFRKGFSLMIFSKGKVTIDENCFFNNYCTITCRNSITIGKGTLFGENVKLYDHNHNYSDTNMPIKHQGYTEGPISIGNHCWIGSNVVILKGVTIGDNCVVGAGCVIYKSVPSNTVIYNKQQLEMKQ